MFSDTKSPRHVYWPPWEVNNVVKCRLIDVVDPDVRGSPTTTGPMLITGVPLGLIHWRIKLPLVSSPMLLVIEHVSVNASPAIAFPLEFTDAIKTKHT